MKMFFKFASETSCLQYGIENDHHSTKVNENECLLSKSVLRREEQYLVGLQAVCLSHVTMMQCTFSTKL